MSLFRKISALIFISNFIFLIIAKVIIEISWNEFFILFILINLICLIVSYLVFRNISKRLLQLHKQVTEMASGNFLDGIRCDKNDEISHLAAALNNLNFELKTGVAVDASKDKEIDKIKTDFITVASHQLRTPLAIIKWYSDFILAGDAGQVNVEQKHYLHEIYISNERLIELVNALLDVSRIDLGTFSIDPEPSSIISIAQEVLDKYRREVKQRKILIATDFDKFKNINLDPRLMKMVFENLISNSVKYVEDGGRIRFSIKKAENEILIKVSDNGFGIPKDQQVKVFSKMFRADNARKAEAGGTGLGLYIVKAIVENSGGKIWFESPSLEINSDKNKKSGTSFYITIPATGMKEKKGDKKLT